MDDLLSNGLHEKVMIYLFEVDQMCSLLRTSPWKWLFGQQMKKEEHDQNY